jgi:hypothetical protein
MGSMGVDVSLDEMWKVLEDFGIKRTTFQSERLSDREIKDLYLLIKSKRSNHQNF